MSIDPEDGLLNDYLDGRLDAAARAAFEARLAREPALARRVAQCREFGNALRAHDEAPSPAFYARARERFEAGTARRSWFRPLSWEAAGLAAAAMLAAVVFLPGLLRREDLGPHAPAQLSTPPPAEPQPAPQVSGETPPAPRAAPPAAARAKEKDKSVELEKKEVAPHANEDSLRQRADDFAAPEPVSPPAPAARDVPEERQERFSVLGKSSAQQAPAGSEEGARVESSVVAGFAMEPIAVALPDGIVGRGDVRSIESRDAWLDLLARLPAGDLPPPRDDLVLILIGPRDAPFVCAPIAIVPREGARVIELRTPGAGEQESPGGCAIVLPRAGGRVRVVGPGESP